ncbi:MAG: 30S ribosomal protein S15 [Treponema sp.]|jgi:ribosomal protein S15|nr:30S ribosomal protein S15 [Treponema sp.]
MARKLSHANKLTYDNTVTSEFDAQIALLTEQINWLTKRCRLFKKGKSGLRYLSTLIEKRRKMLNYIQLADSEEYHKRNMGLGLLKQFYMVNENIIMQDLFGNSPGSRTSPISQSHEYFFLLFITVSFIVEQPLNYYNKS